MKSNGSPRLGIFALALVTAACGNSGGKASDAGVAGATGSGGTAATVSTGGNTASGGVTGTGGGQGTGGAMALGGAVATGGLRGTGGATPSGGTTGGGGTGRGGASASRDGGMDAAGSDGSTSSGGSGEVGSAAGGSTGTYVCDATKPPAIKKLGLQTVVQSSKLKILVYVAQPPGSSDWYLVDVLGYVYVYSNGVFQNTPFLDVSAEVQNSTYASLNYDERGLLSIAFPPDYQTSGKFYVALTPTSSATEDHDLLLEYQRSASNPLVADTSTRKAILDLPPGGVDGAGYNPNTTGVDLNKYHNGSTVLFGPDGMLYFGLGEGGGECNSARPGVPQDITSPYGKMLRLDPNAAAPYAAAGNPFASNGDARVLHWGFRNPYRFGFDSLTGDLYIGDVGQWNWEEIDYAPAGSKGLNFGWPDYEGNDAESCKTTVKLAAGATHTPPIATIQHPTGTGATNLVYAIVGGRVYRGAAIPELYGAYLYGEYYANHDMRALYQCGTKTSSVLQIHKQCDVNLPNDPCFTPVGNAPQLTEVGAIVEGNDGELYLAANSNALLKIVRAP
jgi:glucose/arabinose dehydrogenase